MALLGKRASSEAASSEVALLETCLKDRNLSKNSRKILTAEVLDTLDEEVVFLVRSSVSRGKYHGCLWSKAMLEALDPSVWPLLVVHKAFRATRIKPIAEQGQKALALTAQESNGNLSKEIVDNVVVLAPLRSLDDTEIGLLHQGASGETRGVPLTPTDFLGATTPQLLNVELVAGALKMRSTQKAILDVLALRKAYAAKKRRQDLS